MIIVVMGVTGTGKSTIGKLLAERLALPFIEGDDYHSRENISKMSQGIPLTDEDRFPWLQSLSGILREKEKKKGAVLACSALKESYREILQNGLNQKITWMCLIGTEETLKKRIDQRKGHFMPEALLHSQLETLEIPEYAHCFSVEEYPDTIVNAVLKIVT